MLFFFLSFSLLFVTCVLCCMSLWTEKSVRANSKNQLRKLHGKTYNMHKWHEAISEIMVESGEWYWKKERKKKVHDFRFTSKSNDSLTPNKNSINPFGIDCNSPTTIVSWILKAHKEVKFMVLFCVRDTV